MDLLFRGGTLILPEGRVQTELRVHDGVIAQLGQNLPEDGATSIDLSGRLLLPGAIDAHTHMATQCAMAATADDYFTGTRAGLCGGTTTIIDYLLQEKGEPLPETLRKRKAMAAPDAAGDYAFHIGVQDLSTPELLDSVADVMRQGVTSFKAYMVYDFGLSDEDLYRLLRFTAPLGGLVAVHAENRGVIDERVKRYLAEGKTDAWWHYMSRDEQVEAEADERALRLAQMAEAPLYLVHLANEAGMAAVTRARDEGQPVFAETCPQYLAFTSEVYRRRSGRNFVCSPPIKGEASQAALWRGLIRGDVSTVATDHCPFQKAEKDYGLVRPDGTPGDFTSIPNGCSGVETMYPYLLSEANRGRLPFERVAAVCARNPARLFGLDHRKGALLPGLDADLVVFDPQRDAVVRSRDQHGAADHTIWEGTALHGAIDEVYSRGRLAYKRGDFLGRIGGGQFLECRPVHPKAGDA